MASARPDSCKASKPPSLVTVRDKTNSLHQASSQKQQQGQSKTTKPLLRADAYKSRGNITKSNTGVYGDTVKIKRMVYGLQKYMITASSKDLSFGGNRGEEKN